MADIEFNVNIQNTQNFDTSFTNSLNINLQKEITMGIELNSPLYIGADTNLQKQVAQNTADISDLKSDVSDIEGDIGSLSNLATSDKSNLVNAINETLSVLDPTQTADYIKNSKGLESGEISTNASILPWVEEMSHSTFDLSKFTKVGSPVITDDGIASGFSGSNYLNTTSFSIIGSWKIFYQVNFSALTGQNVNPLFQKGNVNRIFVSSTGHLLIYANADSTSTNFMEFSTITINLNTNYLFEISYDGNTTYTFVCHNLDNGTSQSQSNTFSDHFPTNSSGWFIGSDTSRYLRGSIDLKQFSITVDGVEVFSGNKTGIDTIKPDNYTVVGTPTISADGVASGFSSGNYITGNVFDLSKPWKIETKINTGNIGSDDQGFFSYTSYFWLRICPSTINNPLGFCIHLNDNEQRVNGTRAVQANTEYSLEFAWTGSQYYLKVYLANGTLFDTLTYNSSEVAQLNTSNAQICILGNFTANMANYFQGSINLNSFKIYVDGNLVYQPCLKIPYTWSKTGSKIADSIYRDRVNDMAEQFGFAPYYTLSDTDFTLPQVELYGLIGAKTLRDSYENGINKWYLYSNRDLEQQGSCTSGVEVTLPKPFADTNYILTVPYSAKSATAFTPTQTGDWYAKGKGIL